MIKRNITFIFITIIFILVSCNGEKQKIKKIACIGDSITYGEGLLNRPVNSYPAQLKNRLGLSYDVKNFGVSGATMLKTGDLSYWNQPELDSALAFNPDVIFIMLGSNDSKPWNWDKKEEYKNDYLSLINKFQELPSKPQIYICNPPPAFKIQWGINDSIIRKDIIPIIDTIAKIKKLQLIDMHSPFMGKGLYFPDFIHPDSAGASLIAKTIAETLIHN